MSIGRQAPARNSSFRLIDFRRSACWIFLSFPPQIVKTGRLVPDTFCNAIGAPDPGSSILNNFDKDVGFNAPPQEGIGFFWS